MAMNSNPSTWSQPEGYDGLAAIGDQDFGNLFNDLTQFEFLNYDQAQEGAGKIPDGLNLDLLAATTSASQNGLPQTHHGATSPHNAMFDLSAMHMGFENQQQQQQQQNHNQFSMPQSGEPILHHSMMPPTPNSVEMHGDANRYHQHMEAHNRLMMHNYALMQQRKGNVSRACYSEYSSADHCR
jgi:hypothetical protein